MSNIQGGCLCGDVRFEITSSPDRVGICHCLDCRKHHGALFYAAAIFNHDSVKITGETNHYKDRHFCPKCGSSVFAKTGDETEVHLGAFDQPNQFVPTYELWCARREDWLPPFAATKQFTKEREDEG